MAKRGYRTTTLALRKQGTVKVYASAKIGDALQEITKDMNLYEGVRLLQVLEAVYVQGRKDGARRAFEGVDKSLAEARKGVPHRTPGRPRRKR